MTSEYAFYIPRSILLITSFPCRNSVEPARGKRLQRICHLRLHAGRPILIMRSVKHGIVQWSKRLAQVSRSMHDGRLTAICWILNRTTIFNSYEKGSILKLHRTPSSTRNVLIDYRIRAVMVTPLQIDVCIITILFLCFGVQYTALIQLPDTLYQVLC